MHEILAKHSLYVCHKVLLSSYSIFWSAVNLEGNGRCFEFLYTNTHPGKEKTVTTGILYYTCICNPWPNMNTLCKFCELLKKKKHFFFFFGGRGHFWKRCKFDERCHRFITSTNMTNFVIPPSPSAISVPRWNHQKSIGFFYDFTGNRN